MRRLLLGLLFTVTASAQTLEQVASIRIDDQPMSARAAAMGGASDALAPALRRAVVGVTFGVR